MKRDVELIRSILLAVEAETGTFGTLSIEGYDQNVVGYHCVLLEEAGFLILRDVQDLPEGFKVVVGRLTWAGHDLLDAARSDKRWEAAMAAMHKAGGWPLDILASVLIDLARREGTDSVEHMTHLTEGWHNNDTQT